MKTSIIVKVSDIRSVIQDVRRSGCDIVSLEICEAEEFDGEVLPASISVSACREYQPSEWIDFDAVEAVPNEEKLEEASLNAIHMSDNLL